MEYKHFSHSHSLTLYKVQAGQQFNCHGCNLPCHDMTLCCWNCNFFLHEHCGHAGRHMKHPSHTLHPLVLVPSPTYCSGSFLCNACGAPGSAFSYCCTLCEVDLHLPCAFLPPKLRHNAHHHELDLSFGSPDQRLSHNDHCKICAKEMSTKHWSYFCGSDACFFRVHTFCAMSEEVQLQPEVYGEGQNTRAETELTPEEIIALEMSRLNMEFQMAQALADIIAYPRFF